MAKCFRDVDTSAAQQVTDHHTGSDGHLLASTPDLESSPIWDVPANWPVDSDVPSGLRSMTPYPVGCAESSGLFFNANTPDWRMNAL